MTGLDTPFQPDDGPAPRRRLTGPDAPPHAPRRGLFGRRAPVVSVLRLTGPIGGGGRFGRGLEDAGLAALIERAFKPRRLAAVALAINSPGGSPTQSAFIAARIRDLAEEKSVPVFAFCEDVAASGGYVLACAADEIYAGETSVVGSIGVITASFGFPQAMARLGVERRVQTAGLSKARLDPFLPEREEDKAWLAALQKDLHETFIGWVRHARGDRLPDPEPEGLFSGDVWLAREAKALGLIDGVGRLRPVLRARFGERVRFEIVAPRRGFFDRFRIHSASDRAVSEPSRSNFEEAAAPEAFGPRAWLDELERRALWGRFGL